MTTTPFRRALAALLIAQPVFWMSSAAYAQALQSPVGLGGPSGAATSMPVPFAPVETEVVRADRGLLSTPAPAIDETVDPDRYVCGPGDVLDLNFWGVQNFKLRVAIDVEGRAFVSKVGYFALQGKTLSQTRRLMRDSIGRIYPRLNFDVTLAEPRTFLVQVVDDVVHTGPYTARAIDRVATVIARAGGFGPNASKRRVEIHRRDGSVLRADLLLYALTGDLNLNPYLLDGDVVRVAFEGLAATIGGAVNRPGRYELLKTRDLAELIELGGGLSDSATQLLPVSLVRRGEGDRSRLLDLAFREGQLPVLALQADDQVRIPAVSELQQSVTVIGAIAGASPVATAVTSTSAIAAPDESTATRRFPFVKGDTVRSLLERAGGVGPLADLGGSYIVRGGLVYPIDLAALVMRRDFSADRPIELGDTLVVPFKRRNILVAGAVFAPGSYPYNPSFGIEQYVALAGGRSRNAQSIESVRVILPAGETKDFRPDLQVEPGSSVIVPEKTFSRSEVAQLVLGAAGIVLSGVAVAIAARK
jgi:polysaccharide biosynthesis/export protein